MRYASRSISVVSSVLVLAGLAACASPPTSSPTSTSSYPTSTYPAQYPQRSYVEYGRVSNIEVLRTQEQGQSTGVGAVIGGVTGAVIGRQIGGGSGRDVATVIGAVGGAVVGNTIEKNRTGSINESYRVSIQIDNGTFRAYDVPAIGDLRPGDRVRIENGQIFRY